MTKIEERHDKELIEAINRGNLKALENKYHDLLKNATLEDAKALEKLYKEIVEVAQNVNTKASEALAKKIEANHQRKLRYHHVHSTNYKVGITKSNELEDFLTSSDLNPEDALMAKEKQNERKDKLETALQTLKPIDLLIFSTYQESGFYPSHQNWKELSETLLTKGIQMSDKTVKKHFIKIFIHLQSLVK
ncbi:hypothetical protein [Lactococcus petauri]|uniref:hypothetical protein n=1 Tax=Lactococcus petauri TaxID=1940789 RepID=UPI0038522DC8